jgi:hypothetical protein
MATGSNISFYQPAPVALIRPSGAQVTYGYGASTDVMRGTALRAAVTASVSGDLISVGPGTFDIDTLMTLPAGVDLVGSGLGVTIIRGSSLLASDGMLRTGADCLVADLTLDTLTGNEAVYAGGGLGWFDMSHLEGSVRVERVHVLGSHDCVMIAFQAGTSTELTFIDCLFETRWQGVGSNIENTILGNNAGVTTLTFERCEWLNDGGTGTAIYSFFQAGSTQTDTVVRDSVITCVDGTAVEGVSGAPVGSTTIYNTKISTAGSGAVLDLAGGVGGITVDATTVYDATKTSGTITKAKAFGVTPGATGIALLDDTTAAAARATLAVNVRMITFIVATPTGSLTTGDNKVFCHIPASLNGGVITAVHAAVATAGTTGTTDIQIARVRSGTPADVLSTKLTIDSTETGSDTAATAAVINASNDDLATNDRLRIDIDAVSTTAPLGLVVTVEVTL